MTVSNKKIAVCSRSFSKHPVLRNELLSHFPEAKFNDEGLSLEGDALIKFLADAPAAIIALEKINNDVLQKCSSLKMISKYGVGLDNLDLAALDKNQVYLGHTPGVNKRSVSELVLGYILSLYRKINLHSNYLTKGNWKNEGGLQLTGRTVGIIGAGNVGKDLMELLRPFNCQMLFTDHTKMPELENTYIKQVELNQLLETSDIVTVHIPYNQQNHLFLNSSLIKKMKKGSIFINTSRGGIVDEEALYLRLKSGDLLGAAMDVYQTEPDTKNPLFSLPHFIGTPHVGGSSDEAILAMGRAAISHLVGKLK